MEIQYAFELAGTGLFAISGALRATQRERPEWLGVSFVGFITAIGGGSLRDMLLGSYPLVWIGDVRFLHVILIGIVLARLFYPLLARIPRTLFLFDTLGIALFTILGTEKALAHHVDPAIAILMGMFSAVMGGVIRDVLTQREPILFSKEIYAMACIAGAFLYVVLDGLGCSRTQSFCLAGGLIVLVRIVSVQFHLAMPPFPRTTETSAPGIISSRPAGNSRRKHGSFGTILKVQAPLLIPLLDLAGLLNVAMLMALWSRAFTGLRPAQETTLMVISAALVVVIAYHLRRRSQDRPVVNTMWHMALGSTVITLLVLTAPTAQWLGYLASGALATGHAMHLFRAVATWRMTRRSRNTHPDG